MMIQSCRLNLQISVSIFGLVEKGERDLRNLLQHILIRRTRNQILRWYGYDAETHLPVDPTQFDKYLSQ